jgi:hypothetical protein
MTGTTKHVQLTCLESARILNSSRFATSKTAEDGRNRVESTIPKPFGV